MDREAAQNSALEKLFAKLPQLEDTVEGIFNSTESLKPPPPGNVTAAFMEQMTEHFSDQIVEVTQDQTINSFSEFHLSTLTEFLTDGVTLLDSDEAAFLQLPKA